MVRKCFIEQQDRKKQDSKDILVSKTLSQTLCFFEEWLKESFSALNMCERIKDYM